MQNWLHRASGLAEAKSSRQIDVFCRTTVHPRVRQGSAGGEGSGQGEAALGAQDVSILSSSSWEPFGHDLG